MMSVERSFEAWEEVQRHGLDLADRLTNGFNGLIQSHTPSFNWSHHNPHKLFAVVDFNTHNCIFDIGNKLGQAGFDLGSFGNNLNGVVSLFFRKFPSFKHEEDGGGSVVVRVEGDVAQRGALKIGDLGASEDVGVVSKKLKEFGFSESEKGGEGGGGGEGEAEGFSVKLARFAGKTQGLLNISSTFDSRTRDVDSSLVARGDFWRVEASRGSSISGNENPSLFLVQLGPVLFVRDSTLLLLVHLSKQHLLWYGYDRKNGMHSLCPVW